MLIVIYLYDVWIFNGEDIGGYFHICGFTSDSISLCIKKDVDGKNFKYNKTVCLKKGGSCHKEWASMENGQFVTENHSCPISSLDVPGRVHLKEGIRLHYCLYTLKESWIHIIYACMYHFQ